jgi:hypothetical protein
MITLQPAAAAAALKGEEKDRARVTKGHKQKHNHMVVVAQQAVPAAAAAL